MHNIYTSVSILSADFSDLRSSILSLPDNLVDFLHIDVMDGHFVPNLTFGPPVIKYIKDISHHPLDIHLMVDNPESIINDYIKLKPYYLVFHIEATNHPERLLRYIKQHNIKAGIALNPATDWSFIRYIYPAIDQILVMTVNPGYGGQVFISEILPKIKEIRDFLNKHSKEVTIAVDGGINENTSKEVIKAGANLLISGSFIFKSSDKKKALMALKGLI